MESIYRSIIVKSFKGLAKRFCLSALLLGLCFLCGCGGNVDEKAAGDDVVDQEAADEKVADEESASLGTEEPLTMMQLLGSRETEVAEDTDPVEDPDLEIFPDTVLWFNATYALLTYSNGMDWRLPGGWPNTYINERITQIHLEDGWDVVDRESAIETLEWLKEEGHRETYREYQEELEQLGMLDLDTAEFLEAFADMEVTWDLYRYIIVYSLYQIGLDEDAITAWDLCRVNQLCGDYYISGYMTYEEAMDISLENSLFLQEKFSSWDELVYSYMLGYQFWQGDPALTDDSPTLERYHYYEQLLEMEDGPYSLDWDMELKKEW